MDKKTEIRNLLEKGYAPIKIMQMGVDQGYTEKDIEECVDAMEKKRGSRRRWISTTPFWGVCVILMVISTAMYYNPFKSSSYSRYTTISGSEMSGVDTFDPRMLTAIKKAQQELPLFKERYNAGTDDLYLVKVKFQGRREEHIWCQIVSIENTDWKVKISNDPEYVSNLEYGDVVNISEGNISDWIIMKDDKRSGGYTFDLLIANMSSEEKRYYEDSWVELAQEEQSY